MTLGVLAQLSPPATTMQTLYTCPANNRVMCKIVATNRDSLPEYIRVALSPGGASLSNEHYIAYGVTIPANDSVTSVEISLKPDDVVRAYSNAGYVSFSLVAIEDG